MITYDEILIDLNQIVANKLFTTFFELPYLDDTIHRIVSNYTILYDKIFILAIKDSQEYVCTYNVDQNNMSTTFIMPNTVLLHRQKHTNTLYSINAINTLIKDLNNGILDREYKIEWEDYKNSILLTRRGEFVRLETKIYDIFKVSED